MSWLSDRARADIRDLTAYHHASWEPGLTRMHANELPWRAPLDNSAAGLNRYPEPQPPELAARLAALYGVGADWVLPGRGSDEAIDLLMRGFCRAGVDAVLITPPTFGMFGVAARIQGATVMAVPLPRTAASHSSAGAILASMTPRSWCISVRPTIPPAISWIAAPCSSLPTRSLPRALLVVDEAYVEFSAEPASLARNWRPIPRWSCCAPCPRRTAWPGRAAARCWQRRRSSHCCSKVIPPYAMTQLTVETVSSTAATRIPGRRCAARGQYIAERTRLARPWARNAAPSASGPATPTSCWWTSPIRTPCWRAPRRRAADARCACQRRPAAALRISVGTPEQNEQLLESLS